MSISSPFASTQPLEAAASTNQFQRRLAVCLVMTALHVIVVANFAGQLYRASAHDLLQQIGVTLRFAGMAGSLTRVWLLTLKSRPR